MMENIDKENIRTGGKVLVESMLMRTPLQDVNFQNSVPRSSKIKACYSQITPVKVRTPTRTQLKMKPSLLAYRDKTSTSVDDVAINSLVYKKVKEIIKQATEEFKSQLAEKDKVIQELTDKLSCETEGDGDNMPTDAELDQYIDSTLSTCVSQLQTEKLCPIPSIQVTEATPLQSTVEATKTHPQTVPNQGTILGEGISVCEDKKMSSDMNASYETAQSNSNPVEKEDPALQSITSASPGVRTCSGPSQHLPQSPVISTTGNDTTELLSTDPDQVTVSCTETGYSPVHGMEPEACDSNSKIRTTLFNSPVKSGIESHLVAGSPIMCTSETQTNSSTCDTSIQCSSQSSEQACSPVVKWTDLVEQTIADTQVDVCDTSIQCATQLSEQACSPVVKWTDLVEQTIAETKVDVCDTSMQCAIDSVEQACSPIVSKVTLVDQSCSPEIVQNSGVSTMTTPCVTPVRVHTGSQIQPEHVSVTCSPMQMQTRDEATQVVADQREAGTMTGIVMHNQETCMTPLKLQNKQGHRLTAENVRKQHPRTVANKIDTLELENQRLMHEVTTSTKKQDSLKSQIKELKSKLKEQHKLLNLQEEKSQEDIKLFKDDYDKQIEDLQTAEIQKQDRICTLEAELETSKKDMQAEISQYTSQIAVLTDKYQTLEGQIMELQTELDKRDNSHQLHSAHVLIQELQIELAEYTDLAESIQSTEKLQAAMHLAVRENSQKVHDASKQLQHYKRVIDSQAEMVNEQKKQNEEESLRCEKIHLESQRQCEEMKTKVVHLHDLVEKYKNEVQILEKKLEYQVQEYDMIEKDLYEVREYAVEQSDKLQQLETENRHLQQEQESTKSENYVLRDRCAVLQAKCQELKETLNYTQEELTATKEHASRLITSQEDELCQSRISVKDLRDKMSQVLVGLRKKVGIQNNVEQSDDGTDSNKELDSTAENRDLTTDGTSRSAPSSFLSEIMLAVQDLSSPDQEQSISSPSAETLETSPRDPPSTQCTEDKKNISETELDKNIPVNTTDSGQEAMDLRIVHEDMKHPTDPEFDGSSEGFVKNGSFDPVALTTGFGDEVRESSAFASVKGVGIHPRLGPLLQQDSKAGSDCSKSTVANISDWSLVDQLEDLLSNFTEIIRLAYILDKASRLSISDLKDKNEELSKQMVQYECSENRLHSELVTIKEQHFTMLQQVKEQKTLLKAKSEELSTQEDSVEELRGVVNELQRDVKQLKHEKGILHGQLKTAAQFSTTKAQESSNGNPQNEILSLKMKNQQLHEKLIQKNEYYDDIGSKAARRIKILEENWKKAESEVFRFDELVEKIRRVLLQNDSVVRASGLHKLLEIIDGKDNKGSGHLHPVKTAKW